MSLFLIIRVDSGLNILQRSSLVYNFLFIFSQFPIGILCLLLTPCLLLDILLRVKVLNQVHMLEIYLIS